MQMVSSEQLVTDHLPYTAAITNDLLGQYNLRKLIRLDDAVAYARVGLMEAASRFRPDTGASFATFSYPRIRGAVMTAVRRNYAQTRLLADRQNDDVAEWYDDQPEAHRPRRSGARAAFDPTEHLASISLHAALSRAVNALSEVERQVILLYYFEDITFDRIAARLGFTRSYVARVHRRALPELARRLHKIAAEYGLGGAAQ